MVLENTRVSNVLFSLREMPVTALHILHGVRCERLAKITFLVTSSLPGRLDP